MSWTAGGVGFAPSAVRLRVGDQHAEQRLVTAGEPRHGRQGRAVGARLERQPEVQNDPGAVLLEFDARPADLDGPAVNTHAHYRIDFTDTVAQ